MITKIRIRGYRIYKDFLLKPNAGVNILVGDNDAGKSTLMEAISLALNGRMGGRGILEELNPHWFNTEVVAEFLSLRKAGKKPVKWSSKTGHRFRSIQPALRAVPVSGSCCSCVAVGGCSSRSGSAVHQPLLRLGWRNPKPVSIRI
ncbi:AAA family ATPase [Pseudomonas sp. LFM046]|uniref:AAA family ATPase n=1 Tax=Pseudomonas sp. LFM046 TaxID=1608357 RepID=UPI001F5B2F67|nr:AAA family ATPase [Pseudomonas sp. LFM046]